MSLSNNQPSPLPPASRRFDSMWWARRGVIVLAVMIVLVFGTEATLATLRRRDVIIHLNVYNPNALVTQTPAASPAAGPTPSATPVPAILSLAPTDRLIVDVQWNYHIGPRFPQTVIHATVLIDDRNVAEGQVNIDCGTAVIDCIGDHALTLAYTIPDTGTGKGSQTVDWPVGSYTVTVDRSDGGLRPVSIAKYDFQVTDGGS